ncbi:50S ribosomal protein L13 [Candidatus Microgenomates bacterium]|nr:50S ribosomal protein L13 [Candidatus Microgenomates bacterium]
MKKFIRKIKKSDKTESARKTYIIDAEGKVLGKIATKAADLLRGKNNANFAPYLDNGGNVIVLNAGKMVITGKKLENKVYRHHTLYPGGLKTKTMQEVLDKNPGEVIRMAVLGMLPKNRLRSGFIKKLTTVNDGQYEGKGERIEIKS